MADATLRFDTRIDVSQVEKKIDELKAKIKDTSTDLKSAQSASNKLDNEWQKLSVKRANVEEKLNTNASFKTLKDSNFTDQNAMKNLANNADFQQWNDLATQMNGVRAKMAEVDGDAERFRDTLKEQNTALETEKENLAKAKEQQKELTKLAKEEQKVKATEAMQGAINSSKDVGNAIASSKNTKDSANAIKQLGSESAKTQAKGTDMFASFFKLGNMLKLMVVRQILKAVISAVKQGFTNLVNYSQDAKNAVNQMKASASNLSNSLASAVAPLLSVVAPVISKICDIFAMASNAVARFFAILTGAKTYVVATKNAEALASANEDVASSASDAQGALASIDEINDISNQSSGSGSSGTDYNSMFETLPTNASGTFAEFERIKDLISDGFWEGFGVDWEDRVNEIISDTKSIGQSLSNIFNDPSVQSAGQTLYDAIWTNLGRLAGSVASVGLTIGQGLIGGIETWLSSSWQLLANTLNVMMQNVASGLNWIGLGSVALSNILSVFGGEWAQSIIGNIFGTIGNVMMTSFSIITGVLESLLQLFFQPIIDNTEEIKTVIDGALQAIATMLEPVFNTCKEFCDWVLTLWTDYFSPFFDALAQAISDVYNTLLSDFIQYVMPAIMDFASEFASAWEQYIDPALQQIYAQIGPALGELGQALSTLWTSYIQPLVNWISSNVMPIIATLIDVLKFTLGPIISSMGDIVSSVGNMITGVINSITGVLNGIINFLTGVFTGNWSQAWDGIKQIVGSIFGGIISVVKTPLNAVISIVNGFIRGLNKIKIPSWVPVVGGKGINISTIPYLAEGTVVPPNAGEFMAVLGDNKTETEVVSPLSTMKQAMSEVLANNGGYSNRTDELLETLINVVQNKNLLVSDVGKAVVSYANSEYRRTGDTVFEGV